MEYIEVDVMKNILMDLSINEVDNFCKINKGSYSFCNKKDFWVDYYRYHDVPIPIKIPRGFNEWVKVYKNFMIADDWIDYMITDEIFIGCIVDCNYDDKRLYIGISEIDEKTREFFELERVECRSVVSIKFYYGDGKYYVIYEYLAMNDNEEGIMVYIIVSKLQLRLFIANIIKLGIEINV